MHEGRSHTNGLRRKSLTGQLATMKFQLSSLCKGCRRDQQPHRGSGAMPEGALHGQMDQQECWEQDGCVTVSGEHDGAGRPGPDCRNYEWGGMAKTYAPELRLMNLQIAVCSAVRFPWGQT